MSSCLIKYDCHPVEFIAMGEFVPESLVPELTDAEELGMYFDEMSF
jgi:hypothetical protein